MKCCFLADGNDIIGMGHIMRCTAIADVMMADNISVLFLTKYEQGKNFLVSKNFEVIMYNDFECLESKLYDFVVIDSYDISSEIFKKFRRYTKKLIYIDDLNLFDYNVDLLINTSMSAKYIDYNFSAHKKYLLGSKYCILRKEFGNVNRKNVSNKVNNILITTGGSDAYNMTYKFLEFLVSKFNSSSIKYHVIIGQAFNDTKSINKIASQRDNIILYNSPRNMAEIMNLCDIAISAGGNTLYELCACGLPTIAFIYADNQIDFVRNFEVTGCISNIGFYNNIDYKHFDNILNKYINDYSFRKSISDKQYSLVDGMGVHRIVDEIKNL